MARRLTGAALNAKVLANVRAELAEDYGLPMDEYDGKVDGRYDLGSDMQPILYVKFTRRGNGRTIEVSDIHPGDDGTVSQRAGAVDMR